MWCGDVDDLTLSKNYQQSTVAMMVLHFREMKDRPRTGTRASRSDCAPKRDPFRSWNSTGARPAVTIARSAVFRVRCILCGHRRQSVGSARDHRSWPARIHVRPRHFTSTLIAPHEEHPYLFVRCARFDDRIVLTCPVGDWSIAVDFSARCEAFLDNPQCDARRCIVRQSTYLA